MKKKVKAWRAAKDDFARLRKIEEDVAQSWLDSLSEHQRRVFFELMDSRHGVLQEMLFERRIKGAVRKQMQVHR